MANFLNSLGSDKIVFIYTFDEPKTNRLSGGLPEAIYRCGGSREVFGSTNFKYRSAYILIGIPGCGEGNGIELYHGDEDNSTEAYCETTVGIKNGNLEAVNKTSLLTIAADRIIIQGETTLLDWKYPGKTTIHGGMIETETITAQQIASRSIDVEKLRIGGMANELSDGSFERGLEEWGEYSNVSVSTVHRSGSLSLFLSNGGYIYSKFLPVQPGTRYYCRAYGKTDSTLGTLSMYVYWYDANKQEISSSLVAVKFYFDLTDWAELSGTVTAPSNALYARVYITCNLNNGGFVDDVLFRAKIGGELVVEGTLTTDHIRFSGSQPSSIEAGMLWYDADKHLIKFAEGPNATDWYYIPKYPLYGNLSTQENFLPNACFEYDQDGDGKPDYWDFSWENDATGSYGLDSVNHVRGRYSAFIAQESSQGHGAFRSLFIPVHGGKRYYVRAYVKVSSGTETFNPLAIEWYDKDKQYIEPPSEMENKEIGTDFTLCEVSDTAPSNARYARVYLGNRGISGKWVYFDDVTFSGSVL